MKKFLLLIFATTMLAAPAMAKKKYVPQRNDYTFKTKVFATDDNEGSMIADSIITYAKNKRGTIKFVSYTQPLDTNQWRGFGDIEEKDINFDGVPDLQICLGPTNAWGGFTYDAYVWDNKKHGFVHIENYDEILDPVLYPNDNRIIGTLRIDNDIDTSVYEWQQGKLVLIEQSRDKYPTD